MEDGVSFFSGGALGLDGKVSVGFSAGGSIGGAILLLARLGVVDCSAESLLPVSVFLRLRVVLLFAVVFGAADLPDTFFFDVDFLGADLPDVDLRGLDFFRAFFFSSDRC